MIQFECNRFAKDGTPIVTDKHIISYAEQLLSDYNPDYTIEPWKLDPLGFAEYYLNANLDFLDIYSEEGVQIAGATVFRDAKVKVFDRELFCTRYEPVKANSILIDNETMKEGHEAFARFTILHEAGHFCMHSSVYASQTGMAARVICGDNGQSGIFCRSSELKAPRRVLLTEEDFREHHANTFAAAICMPEAIFTIVAINALRRMGCHEDYYLLPTMRETDYDEVADSLYSYMGGRFRVSKSAARIQLKKLGLVRTLRDPRFSPEFPF